MDVDRYERLVQAGVLNDPQIELIQGLLVNKTGKNTPHVSTTERLRRGLDRVTPAGWYVRDEKPVRIPDFDEPEPDLAIVRGDIGDCEKAPPGPADVALLIEVSDSTLPWDRGTKRAVYARSSRPVYWIVNLLERRIEVHTGPAPEGYQECRIYTASDNLPVIVDGQEIGQLHVAQILPGL
jgi:Uma2 family endonuclease